MDAEWPVVRAFVKNRIAAATLLWLGVPLLALRFVGLLGRLVAILESVALTVGSIHVSLHGLVRVILFGLAAVLARPHRQQRS